MKVRSVRKNVWRFLSRIVAVFVFMALVYGGVSIGVFWKSVDYLLETVESGAWPESPFGDGVATWVLAMEHISKNTNKKRSGGLQFGREGDTRQITLHIDGRQETPVSIFCTEDGVTLHAGTGAAFHAAVVDPTPVQDALSEAAALLPRLSFVERIGLLWVTRPRLTGYFFKNGRPCWRVKIEQGMMEVFSNGALSKMDLQAGEWNARISTIHGMNDPLVFDLHKKTKDREVVSVSGEELMLSLAEAIRIGTYSFTPVPRLADGLTQSGNGWMKVDGGHRQMYLTGTSYEIGVQHGALAGEGVKRMGRRLVYGVGLLYSIKEGLWFPAEAKKLIERQRPFIQPAYFEEMRGLAEGAGVSLELVQMMNIFPEFFHCSGVALMGDATKDGTLLHARVLDYMVGVGLQDEAVVMAVDQPEKNRFVTVGYLGFIGSVTGMNEHQVAIGEMGGAGQGDWDGIPMSLLIRQGLEDFSTLAEVETFMRESPRTCEYYYVLSDGKGPSAIGIAATPEKFETFAPGEFHEQLQQPVDHAVLLSGSGRYEKLVERVKAEYGTIDRDSLIEIIKRPVAMKSNLHNVIFEPQNLHLVVADASRNGPACNEPYRSYSWNVLFPASSVSSN